MKAMLLEKIAAISDRYDPLRPVEVPVPEPGPGQVLIEVAACGVCHTELDEIEGRTPPPQLPVIPGHEVVGTVARTGNGVTRFRGGERVGVGWIFRSDGSALENLSTEFCATGRDVDGGYAEFMVAESRYAHPIPDCFSDAEAAPLLCAGGVGYRALKLSGIENGQLLGLTGFGGSGHLVLQLAKHVYPDCKTFVFARSERERAFALELGADWSGDTEEWPPQPPHAIIDTTPVWRPVLAALERLRPGGRLVINAIRKESVDQALLGELSYERHLWQEKELKTVANVAGTDIAEFLALAAEIPIRAEVQTYPLAEANQALRALRDGHLRGAKVLIP